MKVKIGDKWYEGTPEVPIMAVFTKAERKIIAEMPMSHKRFADFGEGKFSEKFDTNEKRVAWMRDES